MLQVDENELVTHYRQPGGKDWVGLLNNLLWSACWQMGIPESEVHTCLRTEVPDGGVDTRIAIGSVNDVTGYLQGPSIWQFKASDEARVTETSVIKEVNKKFAKERILAGDAYRLCVCSHVPVDSRIEIEGWLSAAIKVISSDAPAPKLLSAADVARMAGHFPSFVQEMRGIELQKGCYTLETWGQNATARTKAFIPNPAFASYRDQILQHVDPLRTPHDPVLPIVGLSGIGKTRCAYEALKTLKVAAGLVLYVDNEKEASGIAALLAATPRAAAILVVDDCSAATRFRLMQSLVGYRSRVRVLTIQHETHEERQSAPELSIERYSDADIEKIMQANYPGLAPERMRAYVHLSDGYLRLAIDLCEHDSAILHAQGVAPADLTVRMYYEERTGNHRECVSALALFARVGREADVADELDALCKWRGFNRSDVEWRFSQMKDSPGFVQRSAVYYRVSPELIAMQAFDDAWHRWANGREDRFLGEIRNLPEGLQQSFLTRVSRSASKEVREIVRNFFRTFARGFGGNSLGQLPEILQLRALIEVDPDFYFPYLRNAVVDATDEQLKGPERRLFGWEPRRQLVNIADQLAQFRSYFYDAEAMLFRLAQTENEPDLGNNATKTWQRLFRPQLSGTPLPFAERLSLLETRLPKPGEPLAPLFYGALECLYDFHGTRLLGSALVAGKIPDPEWRFRKEEDILEYVQTSLRLLSRLSSERRNAADAEASNNILLNAIDVFVRQGYLAEVKEIVPAAGIPTILRAELHSRFNLFLDRAEKFGLPPILAKNNYSDDIVQWLESFQPNDLVGRLIVQVSNSRWDHHGKEAEWRKALSLLAGETLEAYSDDRSAFDEVLSWLHSEKARGAFDFGLEVGKIDEGHDLFDLSLKIALRTSRADFIRGLAVGYLERSKGSVEELNERLDVLQMTNAQMTFYVAQALGDYGRAFERTLEMVRSERLSPLFLKSFSLWIGNRRTTVPEIKAAVDVILPYVRRDFPGSAETMIEFIAYQYHGETRPEAPELDRTFDELAWRVASETVSEPSIQAVWWGEIVKRTTATVGPKRAAELLVKGLMGDNFHIREASDQILSQLASEHPEDVLEELSHVILDEQNSWRFSIARCDWLLALPVEVLSRWLDKVGVRGALAIARHVPAPSLNQNGQPDLHPLTELLLERFGGDKSVFAEFAAGVHDLQPYMGDIAGEKEKEAQNAEKFLHHKVPAVRRWAEQEIETNKRDAERFKAQADKFRD